MSDSSGRLRERIAQTRRKRLEMTEPFERLVAQLLDRRVGIVEGLDVQGEFVNETADHVETLLDQSDTALQVTAVCGHGPTLAHLRIVVKGQP